MSLINSISSVVSPRQDRSYAPMVLVEVDQNGNPIAARKRAFQYYPETVRDGRGVHWIQKDIIGGSHPLYQWTGGEARTISFETVFTQDAAPNVPNNNSGILGSIIGGANLVTNIAKNPVGSAVSLLKGGQSGVDPYGYSSNIASAIAWLRSKTYPQLYTKAPVRAPMAAQPPPKMLLIMPNSGVTSSVAGVPVDSIPVIMMSCEVTYEAFYRQGHPRIVTVSLEFAEIVQLGTSGWGFVSRDLIDGMWLKPQTGYPPRGNENKFAPANSVPASGSPGLSNLLPSGKLPLSF